MKRINTVLWGLLLVILGVVFALNALDFIDIRIFFDGWWTIAIIAPCFIGLVTSAQKLANLIGLICGIVLFLCCQGVLSFTMVTKLIVPTIFIIIGLKMIFGSLFGNKSAKVLEQKIINGITPVTVAGVFSAENPDFKSKEFHAAEFTAVFGSVKCDLREAVIEEDCVINCSAIFGGIDIILPPDVKVKLRSNSLFGGMSDKNRKTDPTEGVTVYISGTCMFGGVDVK
ncbi:MAG: hypothetical protein IKU52_04530 [Clostridia bacterium]|nr:hypothetical protein [Clostridia bacterium]